MPGLEPVGVDSPGSVLRSAREALGLSRREIAEALNLLESTIVAIEDDDSARQPEPVFLRGYVRNYAKLLRIDPEPLVAALNTERRPAATPAKVSKSLASNRWLWPVAGALLATLILVATVVYLLAAPSQNTAAQDDEASVDDALIEKTAEAETSVESVVTKVDRWDPSIPPAVVDSVPTEIAPTEITPGVSVVDGALEMVAVPANESGAPLVDAADGSELVVGPLHAEMAAPTSVNDEAAVEARRDLDPDERDPEAVNMQVLADSVTTIKPRRLNRGTDQIRLDFAQNCWVRVKDATGKMLFSDMGRAGGAMELTGTGPFDLLLGNAPGTTLKWNGEPIVLQPFMRNNVATLKLGESPVAQVDEPKPQQ